VKERIMGLRTKQPEVRGGRVLVEKGRTRMERFPQKPPSAAVQRVYLPCLCCLALADLPGALGQRVADGRIDLLLLEHPPITAVVLVAEFDRAAGWSGQGVICLGAGWVPLGSKRNTGTICHHFHQHLRIGLHCSVGIGHDLDPP
jgi:hypothetical protein